MRLFHLGGARSTADEHSREAPLQRTVTLTAAVLVLWCVAYGLMADAWAAALERVEFESASRRRVSGAIMPGDPIQGDLARPDGAGPFPAVVGLLVDSYATRRGMDCTSGAFATFVRRKPDAYGALVFLAGQSFVDPQRVAVVGFSAGAWVTLSVAEPNSFDLIVPPGDLRFRAAAAFYPPCKQAMARPGIPTIIFIGAVDDWTPAADCSSKVASWGNDGPSVELIVYPGVYHGFYYPHLQPGRTLFEHWLEYNGEAADNATERLQQFLDRHLH
jgi:dienelactone hydrolase